MKFIFIKLQHPQQAGFPKGCGNGEYLALTQSPETV
jgi:hypothetical protein